MTDEPRCPGAERFPCDAPAHSRPTTRPAATDPAGHWYVARDGGKLGPFTTDQFRAMAAAGAVTGADMVLAASAGQWASAGTVLGLLPPAGASHPPALPDAEPARPAGRLAARPRRWVALGAAAVAVAVGWATVARLGGGTPDERADPSAGGNSGAHTPTTPAVERLTVGPGQEVLYAAGLGREAERLGRALGEVRYADGKWPGRVSLGRRGDAWVVELAVTPAAFDDPNTPAAMERWVGVPLAARAFPGDRVEVRLSETGGRERAAFRVDGAWRSPIGGAAAAVYSLGGAKEQGDRLAAVLARSEFDTRVGWVILLARRADGWEVTPLNLRPAELTPPVRRRWAGVAREAGGVLGAAVRVEVLGDDYRPAAELTAGDTG